MGPITEFLQIAAGFVPVNLATAANNGDWVSFADFNRLAIVLFKGAGTAGEDPTITVEQATAAAGTGNKALNFTTVYKKQGADLAAIGQFTTVTQAAGNTFTHDALAEEQAIVVIDVKSSDLDVNNGYQFVQAKIADVGSGAQIGCVLYLAYGAKYQQATLPSILA